MLSVIHGKNTIEIICGLTQIVQFCLNIVGSQSKNFNIKFRPWHRTRNFYRPLAWSKIAVSVMKKSRFNANNSFRNKGCKKLFLGNLTPFRKLIITVSHTGKCSDVAENYNICRSDFGSDKISRFRNATVFWKLCVKLNLLLQQKDSVHKKYTLSFFYVLQYVFSLSV